MMLFWGWGWFCLPYLCVRSVTAQVSTVSEILNDAPSCAHRCIADEFVGAACDVADIATCLCLDVALQNALSECVQTSCVFADQVATAKIETELCAAYPKASRSSEIVQITIAGCAIVFPVVALRLFTRKFYTKKLWMDDYVTILATILLAVLASLNLYNARLGLGMHYWAIPVDRGTRVLKLFYFNSMIYMILLVVGKMSVLLVYLRIFPERGFRRAVHGLNAVLVLHGTLYFLLTALQCLPVESIWDRYITQRRCLNVNALAYSSGILSIAEDVAILLLPVRSVWQLNIHRRRRLTLLALFSIGSFACLTSMIRMRYVVRYSDTFDTTWDSVDIAVWSTIEQFSMLLCGSLPTLRPLLLSVMPRFFSTSRDQTIRQKHASAHRSVALGSLESGQPFPKTHSHDLSAEPLHFACRGKSPGRIEVVQTFEVRREPRSWLAERSEASSDEEGSPGLPASPPPVYTKICTPPNLSGGHALGLPNCAQGSRVN